MEEAVMQEESACQIPVDDDILKKDMIEFIAHDSRPYFQSQQIGDADLTTRQKREIATELFDKSKYAFLSRFGLYLTPDHLLYFENNCEADKYETEFMLRQIRRFNVDQKRNTDIRNRRYEVMKKMISEHVYFTESEMMSREPLLYDQLVGKYLSEKERQERDKSTGEANPTFVNVLLDGIEKTRVSNLLKTQFDDEEAMVEEEDSDEEIPNTSHEYTPGFSQWGEMADVEKPTDIEYSVNKASEIPLTAPEREILKEEFISTMYSNFLDGKDKNFDYSSVDYNSEYDNVDIRAQDEEEKYFDSEEPDCVEEVSLDEEDELDLYMQHLALHPSLQK